MVVQRIDEDAIFQECFQEAIDAERLAAFAQQLGISPDEDEDFGWISEVGLQSPLPPRWTSHTDTSTGYVYYVDHDRQVSSWENPLVPFLRRVVEIGRAYLLNPTETFFEEQKSLLWHQHKHDLDCWNGPFTDDDGRQYYINAVAKISSWQDPRIDAQYIFELQSGLLTSLQEVLPAPEQEEPAGDGTVDRPWRTGNAEVLTLDSGDSSPPSGRPNTAKRTQTEAIAAQVQKAHLEEHRGAVEVLGASLDRIIDLGQDDVEAQRLQMQRKAGERRKARRRAQEQKEKELHPPPPPSAASATVATVATTAVVATTPIAEPAGKAEAAPAAAAQADVGPAAVAAASGAKVRPPVPLPPAPKGPTKRRSVPLPLAFEGHPSPRSGDAKSAVDAGQPKSGPGSTTSAKGLEGGGLDGTEFGPPTQAPSPTAGVKPTLPSRLESRIERAQKRRPSKSDPATSFTALALTGEASTTSPSKPGTFTHSLTELTLS